MSQQCALAAQRANHVPGCIKQMIVPLCTALVQPHLAYCVQFSAPQYKDIELLRSTASSRGAAEGELLTSSLGTSDRTQGNGMKLCQGKFRLDIGKRFFTERVVTAPSLSEFKERLDDAVSHMEAALRPRLSLPPLGLPVTAPASGLRGLSVPGLALLAAWGRTWTGGALGGCGQELRRLKLERPEKGGEEEIEGRPAGRQLPPAAGKREPASPGEVGSLLVVRSRPGRQRAPQGLYA
ncbi:hypothetical protein QYF61_017644 [Mycteria americana]|uniref:Uncharacterized protein n=1 Tax=Mycteria americana TaxID=33587 RepID=A0AAN7N8E9_MYCAM|nr:hypothetical protein QYF61_017644 [Mycteria americana]